MRNRNTTCISISHRDRIVTVQATLKVAWTVTILSRNCDLSRQKVRQEPSNSVEKRSEQSLSKISWHGFQKYAKDPASKSCKDKDVFWRRNAKRICYRNCLQANSNKSLLLLVLELAIKIKRYFISDRMRLFYSKMPGKRPNCSGLNYNAGKLCSEKSFNGRNTVNIINTSTTTSTVKAQNVDWNRYLYIISTVHCFKTRLQAQPPAPHPKILRANFPFGDARHHLSH